MKFTYPSQNPTIPSLFHCSLLMADTGLDTGRMCHWTCLVPSRLSLDEDVLAKEGGKETTDFACCLYPFHGLLRFITSRLPLPCEKTKRPRRRLPLDRVRFCSLCPKHDVYYRASLSSVLINEQMNSSAYTIHEIYFSLL